jgi:hypothetical protein
MPMKACQEETRRRESIPHLHEQVSSRHTVLYDFMINPYWIRMEAWSLFVD